jgi:hypothetical protein
MNLALASLLLLPSQLPGVVSLSPVLFVHDQGFIEPVTVHDQEGGLRLSIVNDLEGAIYRSDLLPEEMPAKVRFARRLVTFAGTPIE